jgi:hypothetical protein
MAFSENLGFPKASVCWTTAERPDGTLYKARHHDSVEGGMLETHLQHVILKLNAMPEPIQVYCCIVCPMDLTQPH